MSSLRSKKAKSANQAEPLAPLPSIWATHDDHMEALGSQLRAERLPDYVAPGRQCFAALFSSGAPVHLAFVTEELFLKCMTCIPRGPVDPHSRFCTVADTTSGELHSLCLDSIAAARLGRTEVHANSFRKAA